MNLSKRDIKLILILISFVIFIGAYVGVYNNYNEKTLALESESSSLQPRLAELKAHESQMAQYAEGIETGKTLMAEELSKYPNDVRSEDGIMFAVELEDNVGLIISTASFGEPEALMEIHGIVEDENGGYTVATFNGMRKAMTYSTQLTYQELKNAVNYINYTPDTTKLDTVSVSYDSDTGELVGSMTIAKYYVTGADDTYYETQVPPMAIGTGNIFGTIVTVPPVAIAPEGE